VETYIAYSSVDQDRVGDHEAALKGTASSEHAVEMAIAHDFARAGIEKL
jgi:hypothetical protein